MRKDKNSIQKKILSINLWTIVSVTFAILAVNLILDFYALRNELSEIESVNENRIINKGNLLVLNNEKALVGMVEDYGFSAVRNFVKSTVAEDNEIIYGIFMGADKNAWIIAGDYGFAKKNDSSNQQKIALDDWLTTWAFQLENFGKKKVKYSKEEFYEFALPVRSGNEKAGVIRYGLSTLSMQQEIKKVKEQTLRKNIKEYLMMFGITIVIFIISSTISKKKAQSIIKPLEQLTKGAEFIASKDYSKKVVIDTDDEIHTLAATFEYMRKKIKSNTENLELEVDKRTKQLKELQKELVDQAHKSGMADIATAVLHNIGNVLNSIVTSSEAVKKIANTTFLEDFARANSLLKAHRDDSVKFFASSKGKMLIDYYIELQKIISKKISLADEHSDRLITKANLIKEVIEAQQNAASINRNVERVQIAPLINDILKLEESAIYKHRIKVEKKYSPVDDLFLQKNKFMQVLMNLFKNAREAMKNKSERIFRIEIYQNMKDIFVSFEDTGSGIAPENLKLIFSHGFTTKKNGHGFGLHSCANYIKEMGGRIIPESEGIDRGAKFTIVFNKKQNQKFNKKNSKTI